MADHGSSLNEETTSRFIETRRWKLHFNEAGAGHPIILLHGTGPGATGWSNFHQNMPALAARYRVIALDCPGWGKSDVFDCTGESRNAVNAEAVLLLMDALKLPKATLIGNSMGGAATLEFMARYPDRISHAVTMGAGLFSLPDIFSPRGMSEGIRIIVDTYLDPSPQNFRRLVEVMVYDKSFVTDELADQRSKSALASKEHLANWLKWAVGHPDGPYGGLEAGLNGLSKSKTPALMIHGRDDRTVPMEATLRTAGVISNARVVILNRCGHWAQLEHREEFNRTVMNFLDQYPI